MHSLGSMPEQVKRPYPWRKMMMMIDYISFLAYSFLHNKLIPLFLFIIVIITLFHLRERDNRYYSRVWCNGSHDRHPFIYHTIFPLWIQMKMIWSKMVSIGTHIKNMLMTKTWKHICKMSRLANFRNMLMAYICLQVTNFIATNAERASDSPTNVHISSPVLFVVFLLY